jgi:DNA-binding MarR family transcriptional regulator
VTHNRSPATDPPIFVLLNEIAIIEHLARNRLEQTLPDGLLAPHFGVLNHLVRLGDGRSPVRIARAFQVAKGAMTNTLQRLEARGFVRLEPDPADGRGKLVFLTPAGRAAREAAIAALAPLLAELARVLPRQEVAALLPGLQRLRAYLDRARERD